MTLRVRDRPFDEEPNWRRPTRLALAALGILTASPLPAQDFQGTARLRVLLAAPAALSGLGAQTPAAALDLPIDRLRQLAAQGTDARLVPLTLSLRPPWMRLVVGDDSAALHLMVDYAAQTALLVSPRDSSYAVPTPDDPAQRMLRVLAFLLLPRLVDLSEARTGTIDGVPARALDLLEGSLHYRFWFARRAAAPDWDALGRTLARLERGPVQALPDAPSEWSLLRVQMITLDYPRARDGLLIVDFLRIEKAPAAGDPFTPPPGFRRVDRAALPNPLALPPRTDTLLMVIRRGEPAPRDLVLSEVPVEVRPDLVRCPPARYPTAARLEGIQGRVVLQFVIDTLGRPEAGSIGVVESPHDSLSAAARETALGCRFTPARIHGRAVRVLVRLPLDFKLNPTPSPARRDTTP